MHLRYLTGNGTLFYDIINLGYYTFVVHLQDKEWYCINIISMLYVNHLFINFLECMNHF